ncbi:SDR family oxidoreductase [Planococcus sp. CP5-4]|uniref:SDR family oxidoreductase n=1 Tax=unclassified Planococcus (in: firmicutes) TaxID=2662419 RepID=UPI001C235A19|nr:MULTISPECIES: SDR family oxidoreductase [unclassified Planococcus (in: firmicutes)]MBU9674445.1 SDR family oxidoreductase [Planococcus sp. CP5-4_YE]MBV0909735.1 SDR family oxidoreductase [Planococcus sp. CP5-4_UN]MBW6064716.1 SDR family oxidoreductase [Planococcus sp. CP5-4]
MTKDVYVITGGSEDLAIALAQRIGPKGTLLLVDSCEKCLEQVKQQLFQKGMTDVHCETSDLTSKRAVGTLAEKALELGTLRGLVHAAGLSNANDSKRTMADNVIGMSLVLEAFLPLANETTSAVMVSSMTAYMVPQNGQYMDALKQQLAANLVETLDQFTQGDAGAANSMSKLAVHLIVEDQAWAWGEKGARLNSVSPGLMSVPDASGEIQTMLDHTPLRRTAEPEEIASAIEFLLSDSASYITGIDLRIDGGTIANYPRMKAAISHEKMKRF